MERKRERERLRLKRCMDACVHVFICLFVRERRTATSEKRREEIVFLYREVLITDDRGE
jgi:hypothetical protein